MYFPVIRNNRNNWLDSAFNDLFDMDWTPRHVATAPAVNVKESDTAFTMDIAAPGLKKEFCSVNITMSRPTCCPRTWTRRASVPRSRMAS